MASNLFNIQQLIQNSAARLLTKTKGKPASPQLLNLHTGCQKAAELICKSSLLIYNSLRVTCPKIWLIRFEQYNPVRPPGSLGSEPVLVPRANSKLWATVFRHCPAQHWNWLPDGLGNTPTTTVLNPDWKPYCYQVFLLNVFKTQGLILFVYVLKDEICNIPAMTSTLPYIKLSCVLTLSETFRTIFKATFSKGLFIVKLQLILIVL